MLIKTNSSIDRIISSIKPLQIIIGFFVYLLICFIAILLFDVFNVFGVRSFLKAADLGAPAVWYHLFSARSPTEYLQCLLLGILLITCVYISGRLTALKHNRLGYFWFLIGILALILLIEEGADFSRRYQTIMEIFIPGSSFIANRAIIFSFYMLIALVPLFKYFKDIYPYRKSFWFLVTGFLVYGFAGIQSVFLGFFGLSRTPLGLFIFYDLLDGILHFPLSVNYPTKNIIAFLFVDYVLEEPIELLAICLLICSIFSFISAAYERNNGGLDQPG